LITQNQVVYQWIKAETRCACALCAALNINLQMDTNSGNCT